MVFIFGLLALVIELLLGYHWQFNHGTVFVFPALLLLSAAQKEWRLWLVLLAAWGLASYFGLLFLPSVIAIVSLSFVIGLFASRWIEPDAVWLNSLVIVFTLGVYGAFLFWRHDHWLQLTSLSTLLTVPIILFWYRLISKRLTGEL